MVAINEVVKFSQRQRQLNANQFVLTTVENWAQYPTGRLIDEVQIVREVESLLSPQRLDKRLNSQCVALLSEVLQMILKSTLR